jgi:hypothetical protein
VGAAVFAARRTRNDEWSDAPRPTPVPPIGVTTSHRATFRRRGRWEGVNQDVVEQRLIIELKTVDQLAPIHLAQALSYLKAAQLPLALVINFNVPVLLRGVRRVVLCTPSSL